MNKGHIHPQRESDGKISPSVQLVEYSSPFHLLVKHSRYLSDWSDPVIRIDVSRKHEDKIIKEVDLSDYFLPASTGDIRLFSEPVCLTEFPHWMNSIKAAVNQVLFNHHDNQYPFIWVINSINHMVRFAGWCVVHGIYQFSSINQKDIDMLIKGLLPVGWYKALDVEKRLKSLLDEMQVNEPLRDKITGASYKLNQKTISFDYFELSKALGIPVRTKELPAWAYEELGRQYGACSSRGDIDINRPITPSSLKIIFESINLLASLPDGFDQIPFIPFHKPRVLATTLSSIADGRTENLSLEDALALLRTAIKCQYELAPIVIEIGDEIRERVLAYNASGNAGRYGFNEVLNNSVRELWLSKSDKIKMPFKSLNAYVKSSKDQPSFIDLIKTVQTSATIIVGVNHARRKNEIIGSGGLPYGMYQGCVTSIESDIPYYKLDIYIEKTLRDWVEMSCNKLVADAVNILEQIRLFSSPLGDALPGLLPDELRDRNKKLFVWANLRHSSPEEPDYWKPYNFVQHSEWFFKLAGTKKIDFRSHQFRRFFSLIYTYRYDNAVLQALSQHLWHFNLDSTRVYVTDPGMREDSERIESLYKRSASKEIDGMNAELEMVQVEYAIDKVKEIIEGNPTGGGMTKHVRRLYLLLLKNAEFKDADINTLASEAARQLKERGYFPSNHKHGVCWVGDSTTKKLGRCYENDKINRDKAHINICSKCPHHFNNGNYLNNLICDLELMESRFEDESLSPPERMALKRESENLSKLIHLEERIHARNAELMADAQKRIKKEAK